MQLKDELRRAIASRNEQQQVVTAAREYLDKLTDMAATDVRNLTKKSKNLCLKETRVHITDKEVCALTVTIYSSCSCPCCGTTPCRCRVDAVGRPRLPSSG